MKSVASVVECEKSLLEFLGWLGEYLIDGQSIVLPFSSNELE